MIFITTDWKLNLRELEGCIPAIKCDIKIIRFTIFQNCE